MERPQVSAQVVQDQPELCTEERHNPILEIMRTKEEPTLRSFMEVPRQRICDWTHGEGSRPPF